MERNWKKKKKERKKKGEAHEEISRGKEVENDEVRVLIVQGSLRCFNHPRREGRAEEVEGVTSHLLHWLLSGGPSSFCFDAYFFAQLDIQGAALRPDGGA